MRDQHRSAYAGLKRSWVRRILEAGSSGVVVAAAVVTLHAPPAEASTQAPVHERVQLAKETLRQILGTPTPAAGSSEELITWWSNWPNGGRRSPHWHNWPNWRNWNNWRNR
jgi:hypothetical protein